MLEEGHDCQSEISKAENGKITNMFDHYALESILSANIIRLISIFL